MKRKSNDLFISMVMFALAMMTLAGCKEDNGEEPQPGPNETQTSINLEIDYLEFTHAACEEKIGFEATADWSVLNAAESWISISPKEGEKGKNLTLTVTVNENKDDKERTAQIIIKARLGQTADTLTVRQAGVSPYVPIDWDKAILSQFDPISGKIEIHFDDRTPYFQAGVSSIVVPTDSFSYIRIVDAVSVSGNTATLQTQEGDMTDVFMNKEFTLSTVPASKAFVTRSGIVNTTDESGIIHPSKITAFTADGQKIVLYDLEKEAKTKGDIITVTDEKEFFNYGFNKDGTTIYDWGAASLSWEKCNFNAVLNGQFYFSFGTETKTTESGISVPKGDLLGFWYFLEGDINTALILKLAAERSYSKETATILQHNVLNGPLGITLTFPVGGVPVTVNINADLQLETKFKAEASAELTGGFEAGINVKTGLNYYKGDQYPEPITQVKPSFTLHKPELTVKGSIEGEVTAYPRIKMYFFNFLGPTASIKPYIGDEFHIGSNIGGSGENNYAAWTNRLYTKMGIQLGLSLQFAGVELIQGDFPEWYWPNEGGQDLHRTPENIKIISPTDNEIEYKADEPIAVTVKVTDYSFLGQEPASVGAVVKFESSAGSVDKQYALTDANGQASVNWTPGKEGAKLTIKITDADGKTIASEVFAPNIKEEKESVLVGRWTYHHSARPGGASMDYEVTYEDILTFNKNGTYSYIVNPARQLLIWPEGDKRLLYAEYHGTYSFDESTGYLTTKLTNFINETNFNGTSQEITLNPFFGISGRYETNLSSNGTHLGIKAKDNGFYGYDKILK